MQRILIVEDDTTINHMIAEYLGIHGFACEQAFSGTEGRLLFYRQPPFQLVILDLMLPGLPGEELLREIRKTSKVPVIVLTAQDALEHKIDLLGHGADDYLTKPFALEELLVRLQVQLRHAGQTGQTDTAAPLTYKEWSVDPEARQLRVKGVPVELTGHEFGIVELLMARPAKVFTKQEIFEAVWRQDYFVEDKTINVHISNIRAKLRPSGTDGYIQTVWGIGFKLGG